MKLVGQTGLPDIGPLKTRLRLTRGDHPDFGCASEEGRGACFFPFEGILRPVLPAGR
jgi:hypothetical protein